VKTMS